MSAPPEIIEAIASNAHSQCDTLLLALTCKYVASVLIPRYTQYRVICCSPLEGVHVWTKLKQDKSLARNVRILHIREYFHKPRKGYLVPRRVPLAFIPLPSPSAHYGSNSRSSTKQQTNAYAKGLEAEVLLIGAICNMTQLESFTWTANAPLITSRTDSAALDVWAALSLHTSIRNLEVEDGTHKYGAVRLPIHDNMVRCPCFQPDI